MLITEPIYRVVKFKISPLAEVPSSIHGQFCDLAHRTPPRTPKFVERVPIFLYPGELIEIFLRQERCLLVGALSVVA